MGYGAYRSELCCAGRLKEIEVVVLKWNKYLVFFFSRIFVVFIFFSFIFDDFLSP